MPPAPHSSQNNNIGSSGLTARNHYESAADYNEIEYARRGDYYQHSPNYGGKRLMLKDINGHI